MTDGPKAISPVRAYLGLGSNLGDRMANLRFAIMQIGKLPDTTIEAISSVYETPPWGVTDQPAFLNLCVAVDTGCSPFDLLKNLLAIERRAGRLRQERWGPRTLDIDIIAFGDVTLDQDGLTLPHPRLAERAFVLAPLNELAPDLSIAGKTVRNLLHSVDTAGITRLGSMPVEEAPR